MVGFGSEGFHLGALGILAETVQGQGGTIPPGASGELDEAGPVIPAYGQPSGAVRGKYQSIAGVREQFLHFQQHLPQYGGVGGEAVFAHGVQGVAAQLP